MERKKIQFPSLRNEQVALLRSDYYTGHVLDDNFNLHVSDEQEMYTVFESLDIAKKYIDNVNTVKKKYKKVEFTIYDKSSTVVFEFVEQG